MGGSEGCVATTEDVMHLWTIGPDTVVAHDEDDAWLAWEEHTGESRADYEYADTPERIDDADRVVIATEDAGSPETCDCLTWASTDAMQATDWTGHHRECPVAHVSKTAAEWAASNGRGFLCSTEW